jgi:3-oxoacyl-[acyl-carrier-protein] synthase III
MASALAALLGIPRATAFDLNAACSGWLYALEVGRSLIRGGSARNVIVVTAELLSRITNPRTTRPRSSSATAPGPRSSRARRGAPAPPDGALGRRRPVHRDPAHGRGRPQAVAGGEGGPPELLHPDGRRRGLQARGHRLREQIEETLLRERLRPEDIAWVVPHQANARILNAVSKRVGIPYEKFVMTIAKYGNTSAASVSMALGWAAEEGIFATGDRIIFCSVGAGLTFAGGLLVW